MKKEETISLLLLLGFAASLTIGLLLDYGGWRKFLVILSFFLLLFSMGLYKGEDHKANRVEKLVMIVFFSVFGGMIAFSLLYSGITNLHEGGWLYFAFFVVLGTAAGCVAYYFLRGKGWLYTRKSWLEVAAPLATREGRGETKAFKVVSLDKDTTCVYYPRLKRLHVIRRLYTDPMRHKEEFQERINNLDGLIKQTELMLDLKANAQASPFFFDIEFIISKRLATEENIKLIKGLLDTLSADDKPIYLRVHIDNEIWFLHIFQNKMVKARVYRVDDIDSEDDQDGDEVAVAKHRPDEILDKILTGNNFDDIREMFEISQEEFEKLFAEEKAANGPCSSDEFINEVLENTNDDETDWDDEDDRGRYIEQRIQEMIDEMNEELERNTDQKPKFEVLMWQGTHFTAKFEQASFPKGYLNVWLEYSEIREETVRRQTEGFVSGFRLIAIRNEEFGQPGTNIIYQIDPEDHTLIPKIDIKEGESVFGIQDFDFNCIMKVSFRPSLDNLDGLIPLYEWEI
ncbi:MAG: hypothetical protein K5920_02660 [Bacteroidales bacterium]|nr:hypothetical protein [Bacteroidales bacterium]